MWREDEFHTCSWSLGLSSGTALWWWSASLHCPPPASPPTAAGRSSSRPGCSLPSSPWPWWKQELERFTSLTQDWDLKCSSGISRSVLRLVLDVLLIQHKIMNGTSHFLDRTFICSVRTQTEPVGKPALKVLFSIQTVYFFPKEKLVPAQHTLECLSASRQNCASLLHRGMLPWRLFNNPFLFQMKF